MIKIIKNTTGSDIDLLVLGITVTANGSANIAQTDFDILATSASILEIAPMLTSGDIVINDGVDDLSDEMGLSHISSGYTTLDPSLVLSDRIKVDVIGSLTDGRVLVSGNDSASGYLEDKVVPENNKVSVTTLNEGLVEEVQIGINPANIGTSELTNDANFLNETSHDALPQDNPHNVTKTQVGLSDVDNTSDLSKPISTATQTALDLKYDASNPDGYETSLELDARDTDNRNRANHTGTQTVSTISDFDSEVTSNTTVVANTAKISADGSIDTHSDVDITTSAPNTNDVLSWDGVNFVPAPQTGGGGTTLHSGLTLDDGTNPHGTTQADVGLGNVDNTSDANKPISTATQTALDDKVTKVTSTDNAIVRFDGITGDIQDSSVTIDDLGAVTIDGGTGSAILTLEADSDNSGEEDTSWIKMIQDGGGTVSYVGNYGTTGLADKGTLDNAEDNYLTILGGDGIQIGNDSTIRMKMTTVKIDAYELLDMNNNSIENLPVPLELGDATNKEYVDTPMQIEITQNSHGFTLTNNVPLPAYIDDATGDVILARANSKNTLSVIYITKIVDANNIIVKRGSQFHTSASHGLTVGHYYFTSAIIAGSVVIDQPEDNYDDISFFVIDANTLMLIDNRPIDQETIQDYSVKTSNSDTTTALNDSTTVPTVVPLVSSTEFIDSSNYYTIDSINQEITVLKAGRYNITFSLDVEREQTGGSRIGLEARLYKNGSGVGTRGYAYLRNVDGLFRDEINISQTINLLIGDVITVESLAAGTATSSAAEVTMRDAGSSFIQIKKEN